MAHLSMPGRRTWLRRAAVVLGFSWLFSTSVGAVEVVSYPSRPVRIIVPFTAGTQIDIAARLVGTYLGDGLGQTVIIENKPGASGNIASEFVAKAAPDGYTLLFTGSLIALLPSVVGSSAVDPVTAFAPITKIGQPAMVIAVSPSLNVNSLPELIALARRQPGKIAYSTPGVGTGQHLAAALLSQRADIDLLHVPYASSSQALTDALSGEVPVLFTYIGNLEAHLRRGDLKLIAVVTDRRIPTWPDVPTVAELGVRDYEIDSWNCVLAPAGTPREVIERLYREIASIVKRPDVRERFLAMGMEPESSTPDQLASGIRFGVAHWAELAKAAGIRPRE
jgi:tripartite-type tricarboxylate transporter receptor subunit TctC